MMHLFAWQSIANGSPKTSASPLLGGVLGDGKIELHYLIRDYAFFGRRFSSVRSATASFSARVSWRSSWTSPFVAARAVIRHAKLGLTHI